MFVSSVSFSLQSNYQKNRTSLSNSISRLSSGDRFSTLGDAPAADLSMSERFRSKIKGADASTGGMQFAMAFLDTAQANAQTATGLLQRMMEVATVAAQPLNSDVDRGALDNEFSALKGELASMGRDNLFFGKQTVGREGLTSYDSNTKRIKFWQSTGVDPQQIERDFDSAALDKTQNLIGFDSTEDFSMSADGKSLFFLGLETGDAAGKLRIKRYDIESHTIYKGSDLFDSGDSLFVDENGSLYVNGSGTIYDIDTNAMRRTATAVTDARSGTQFTSYKGELVYSRTADSAITSYNIASTTTTALTGALTFAVGTDHAFSSSGKYVAEESPAGSIRVIDTITGNSSSLAIGAANSVTDIQFNTDGDRIYYINKNTNTIEYINVSTDDNDNVALGAGEKVVQGTNKNSFNGLDLGGSNYGSSVKHVLSEDTVSVMNYEAIDLSLYNLGLSKTKVDTLTDAGTAIEDIRGAMNSLSAERAKIGAMGSRFQFTMNSHMQYISNLKGIESKIRDVDVAKESITFSTEQVKASAAQSILAQFNSLSKNVLALLQ